MPANSIQSMIDVVAPTVEAAFDAIAAPVEMILDPVTPLEPADATPVRIATPTR